MKKILSLLGLIGLLAAPAFGAGEIQYEPITLVSLSDVRWITATATNFAAVVNCTKHDKFALQFDILTTNASTGPVIVRWSTSLDGVSYASNPEVAGVSAGWFAIPTTNNAKSTTFLTNITVDAIGFWRLEYMTNTTVQHISNCVVRAYLKPQRSGNAE